MSVVKITITNSNMTNNQATTGSGIYLDNSNNYLTQKSEIAISSSAFVNNSGNRTFYSVKSYNSTWNNNIITTSWWGSNIIPEDYVYNFYIKNYLLLTIKNNKGNLNYNWTNNNINVNLTSTNNINNELFLSIETLKEGNILKNITDKFLPERLFSIKINSNTPVQKLLYCNYQLNITFNTIEIKLDNQSITINR